MGQGIIGLEGCNLVLDEADRMLDWLDMRFEPQIR